MRRHYLATMATTLRREEKLLVGYAAVAHGLVHVMELTYAAILPFLLLDFGEGLFVLGVVATFFGFAFGLGALPAGVLADRIGSKRLLEICLLGGALASVGVALSPNIYSLAAFLSLLGLALGLYHPAGMSLISRGVNQKVLGRGLALHGIGGSLGIAAAPVLAAGVAALVDWRVAYLVPAVLSLAAAAVILRTPAMGVARGEARKPAQAATGASASAGRMLLLPLIVVFAVSVINGFIYRGMITFLPLHLKESVHFAVGGIDASAMAGAFASIILLAGTLGQWLGGTLGDRMHREVVLLAEALVVTVSLLLMGVVSGLPLVAVGVVMGVAYFMGQPLTTGLIAEYSPRRLQGRMFGIGFFLGFGLGSFAAAFAGWVAERSGTPAVFLSMGAIGVLTALSAVLLLGMARRRGWSKANP